MKIIYQFDVNETANNIVNDFSLHLEIRASILENYEETRLYGSTHIQIFFTEPLDTGAITLLTSIVNNHQGNTALVDSNNVELREGKIREMTEMALLHPSLVQTDTIEYLTSIDNWLNAWKRSGIDTSLVNKIVLDANTVDHPQATFLNEIVSPQGAKTYEFLIAKITE